MPNTYYVATDGNDGTAVVNNPALPWATLSPIEVICASGDTIEFADGAYNAATLATNFAGDYIHMIDKAVTLKATNAGNVTFSFTDTLYGIRYDGEWGGLTSSIEGIRFIAEAGTTPQYQIGIKNVSVPAGTLNMTNCVFDDESLYTLWLSSGSAFGMNVNVSNCSFIGATTTRSAVRFRDLVTGTALVIDDCAFEANSPISPQNLIDVDAAAAGCSLSVTNSTLYSTTATGTNKLISSVNVDGDRKSTRLNSSH